MTTNMLEGGRYAVLIIIVIALSTLKTDHIVTAVIANISHRSIRPEHWLSSGIVHGMPSKGKRWASGGVGYTR